MPNYIMILILLISILIIPCDITEAEDFVPWNFSQPALNHVSDPLKNLSLPAYLMYQETVFFSKYISPVDGDRCAMYPTCSAYSRQAVSRHGFIMGFIMTADRLIHEHNEVDTANEITIGETSRFYDPVENNDFWWYKFK